MLKSIFYLIRHFPEQVFLFVFNSGIFVWLWKSGNEIANQLGVTAAWENHVPAPIQLFFGQNIEAVQGFFHNSAFMWLVGSMIILLAIRLIKGMIKFVVFALLILLGIYLILQNQSILNSFM